MKASLFLLCLLPLALFGQDSAPVPATVPAPGDAALSWLLQLALANPKLALFFGAMGVLRVVFKTVFAWVHRGDATDFDHNLAAWFDSNKVARTLAWLLDLVASVKLQHPQADPLLAPNPPTPSTPVTRCFLWLFFLLPCLLTGCTTAVQNGYVISQTTRGLGFKFSAISQTGTPGEVHFGYFSTTSELVPTAKGTNAAGVMIASPNYGAAFNFKKTGLLSEEIDETRSFGLTTILDSGATNSAPIIQPK